MYTIYTTNTCPFCTQAKKLMQSKGIEYTEINVQEDAEARKKLVNMGLPSVPQIFEDDKLIPGGYQGLRERLTVQDLGSIWKKDIFL